MKIKRKGCPFGKKRINAILTKIQRQEGAEERISQKKIF